MPAEFVGTIVTREALEALAWHYVPRLLLLCLLAGFVGSLILPLAVRAMASARRWLVPAGLLSVLAGGLVLAMHGFDRLSVLGGSAPTPSGDLTQLGLQLFALSLIPLVLAIALTSLEARPCATSSPASPQP